MTRRIAYLENGKSPDKESGLPELMEKAGFTLDYFWASQMEFPDSLDNYSGIFLSGSAYGAYEDVDFIHKEHDFIRNASETDIPMLGVCFGSQILASALCGKEQVFRRSNCHVGFLNLDKAEAAKNDLLMRGVSDKFRLLIWHNDEAKSDHPDMNILATTDIAPNQIWRYRDKKIWGIQGHPEVNNKNALKWLTPVRDYMEKDGMDIDKLAPQIDENIVGKTLINNFLAVCHDQ